MSNATAYYACFDLSESPGINGTSFTGTGYGTIALTTSGTVGGGGNPITVNLAGLSSTSYVGSHTITTFSHYPSHLGPTASEATHDGSAINHLSESFSNDTFASVLQAALNAAATANSWAHAGSITVALNQATMRYTIGYTDPLTIVAFSTTAGSLLLGFGGSGFTGSSTAVTGGYTPHFIVAPTLQGVSLPTPNYEPDSIASQAVSDSGAAFGISRTITPLYRDWIQQYETKAKTFRLAVSFPTDTFAFDELFRRSRTVLPFVVQSGFGSSYDEVFFFRADGAGFHPDRASDANDAQFHIPFKCLVVGIPGA